MSANTNSNSRENIGIRWNCSKSSPFGRFVERFSEEIDLSDVGMEFPEWVTSNRRDLISRTSGIMIRMFETIKATGHRFKIRYPFNVDFKWKYADAYLPDDNLVVILSSLGEMASIPPVSQTNRELFFRRKSDTLSILGCEIDSFSEILREKLSK